MDETTPQESQDLVYGPHLPTYDDYREIQDRARRDQMTGLLNQEYLKAAVADRVQLAMRDRAKPAFFVFDVDKFKEEVNDKHGHPAGDRLLKAVGEMLKKILR